MRHTPVLALFLLLAGCGENGGRLPHVGEPPPPFTLETLYGATVDVPAALAGKVVVLRFWATWCPSCKTEMKIVQAVWSANRDKGLEVLAINVGQGKDDVAAFVGGQGVAYPVLLDPDSRVSRLYGVTGLPMTLIIGRDGRIKGRILGETDETALRRKVEELL